GIDDDLADAEILSAVSPGESVDTGAFAEAADGDFITTGETGIIGHADGVHAEDDALRPEAARTFGNNVGVAHGKGDDRDLLGTSEKDVAQVVQIGDATTDGERDADGAGNFLDHLNVDAASLGGGGDIVKDELIATTITVGN